MGTRAEPSGFGYVDYSTIVLQQSIAQDWQKYNKFITRELGYVRGNDPDLPRIVMPLRLCYA